MRPFRYRPTSVPVQPVRTFHPRQQRRRWEGLSDRERTVGWMEALPSLGIHCPKVVADHIWYPSLGRYLRGARAAHSIGASEVFCRLPVSALLTKWSVGNSTLQGLMGATCSDCDARPRATAKASLTSILAVFVLRERARTTSAWMPYIQAVLEPQQVDDLPVSWPARSSRFRTVSRPARKLAAVEREVIAAQHAALFPAALARFSRQLGEGIACGARICGVAELAQIYSLANFTRAYLRLRSRDFYGLLYGAQQSYLAPQ